MKKKKRNRVLSLILCGALVLGQMGTTAYAENDTGTDSRIGLCEHHPAHDEACGYVGGHACEHKHTDECYKLVTKCVYIADEDGALDDDATSSDAKESEHVCTEESGCVTRILDCQHEHDDTCDFVEAKSCQYECEICNPKDSDLVDDDVVDNDLQEKIITGWEWFDPKGYLTDGGLTLPGVNPDNQADFDTVVSMLPKKNQGVHGRNRHRK